MKKALLVIAILCLIPAAVSAQCYSRVGSAYVKVNGLEDTTTLWKYGTFVLWAPVSGVQDTVDAAFSNGNTGLQDDLFFYANGSDTNISDASHCPETNDAIKFDYDENAGTVNHKGVYAVTSSNITASPCCSANYPAMTARYIPIPTATVNGADVDLTWSAPTVEVPGDVTGYKVYSLTDGFTEVYVADSATSPYKVVGPASGTYKYCIRLKYRTSGTAVNSLYCSGNSNSVVVP